MKVSELVANLNSLNDASSDHIKADILLRLEHHLDKIKEASRQYEQFLHETGPKLGKLKNKIDQVTNSTSVMETATADINNALVALHNRTVDYFSFIINDKHKNLVDEHLSNYEQHLTELRDELRVLITKQQGELFQKSYSLYEKVLNPTKYEFDLEARVVSMSDEGKQFIGDRITRLGDWRYPALVIHPGKELFIKRFVGNDPVYVMDRTREDLGYAMSHFSAMYQKRLRPYVIYEKNNKQLFDKIPDNQFGIIFAYGFFDFMPFEVIRRYFTEILNKLRPGGTFMFTFNDCDREAAVKLAEEDFACYTPGYLIRDLARSLGYEESFFWNEDRATSWLELVKPGELDTIKGGQSLARILALASKKK